MKIEFDPRAIEILREAHCYPDEMDVRDMLDYMGPVLCSRANKETGETYANIAGRRIELMLVERRDAQLQMSILITVPHAVLQ